MVEKNKAWQFLIIPFGIYILIILFPFFQSLRYSFTDWDGFSSSFNYIGLANYRRVFTDSAFRAALWHNVIWTLLFLTVPTIFGLFLAILLDRDLPGGAIFKSIIYLPMSFSLVVVGMIWVFVYEPRLGILNLFIRSLGRPGWNFAWLAEPKAALFAVIAAAAWQHTGLCMVLYLAGLKGVRPDTVEAARIDGCNTPELYFKIILPQLKNTTIVVTSLTIINSLKSFDIVYIMTKGGPFRKSEVLTTLMYREAFWNYRMGYGSAIANVLFFLILGIIIFYLKSVVSGEKDA